MLRYYLFQLPGFKPSTVEEYRFFSRLDVSALVNSYMILHTFTACSREAREKDTCSCVLPARDLHESFLLFLISVDVIIEEARFIWTQKF